MGDKYNRWVSLSGENIEISANDKLSLRSESFRWVYGANSVDFDSDSDNTMTVMGGIKTDRFVPRKQTNTGSTNKNYPSSLDVSKYMTFILGSSSSARFYKFSGTPKDGQIIYLFNRNDDASCYVQTGVLDDSWEYELCGGIGVTMMYVTDTFYGPTVTDDKWVVVGRQDQNW